MPQTIAKTIPFAAGSHGSARSVQASNAGPLTIVEKLSARNVLRVLAGRTKQIHANRWFNRRH